MHKQLKSLRLSKEHDFPIVISKEHDFPIVGNVYAVLPVDCFLANFLPLRWNAVVPWNKIDNGTT